MKTLALNPTDENVLSTYLSDSIGRNKDIFYFVNILNSLEGSYSISLDGKWGSGKTFFVKQVKMVLEANNEFVKSMAPEKRQLIKEKQYSFFGADETLIPQVCVYYDAWENDSDEDPMLSLVYSIMQTVSTDYTFKERNYLKAGTAILEVIGKQNWGSIIGGLKSGVSILEQLSGMDWEKIIEGLRGENPLAALEKDKSLSEKINEFLDSLLPEKGERLVIFVDELDRCSPSYAVRLLERIKHYFSNGKITFVFSVNISELQYTIKKYYGDGFDGARYLDRFFDLRVQIPKIDLSKYYSQLNFYAGEYTWSVMCDAMIRVYGMELREISRYLQLYQLAIGNHLEQLEKTGHSLVDATWYYSLMYVAPIMVALRVVDPQKYYDFIEGKDCAPLLKASGYLLVGFFSNLLRPDESYEAVPQRPEIKVVTVEQKLKAVYEALFIADYSINRNPKFIGKTRFDDNTKKVVLEVAGLLSKYTRFDD